MYQVISFLYGPIQGPIPDVHIEMAIQSAQSGRVPDEFFGYWVGIGGELKKPDRVRVDVNYPILVHVPKLFYV